MQSAIVTMRRARGLTQAEVGRCVGRAQSVVSRWERGLLEPTLSDLVTMASLLDRPLGEIATSFRGPGRQRSRRGDPLERRRRIGTCLRAARLADDLDAWTVARRTAITPRRLARLERGAEPSIAELRSLISVLPAFTDGLLHGELDTR